MNEVLQHPVLFWICLLGLAGQSRHSPETHRDWVTCHFHGLSIVLWGAVASLIFPRLIVEARLGSSYLLVLNTGFPLLWIICLSFAGEYLAPLPFPAFAIFSVIALIAVPDLLQSGLVLGGLFSPLAPESGLLAITLPILLLVFLQRPSLLPTSLRPALMTLFMGILPACIMIFAGRTLLPNFVATLAGAFLLLGVSQISGVSQGMIVSAGVGGYVAIALLAETCLESKHSQTAET